MATSNVDIVLRARDEATAKLKSVTGAMEGLAGTFSRMSFAMGAGGAVAAGLMAASAAATSLVMKYADVAESIEKIRAVTGVSAANIQIFRKSVEMAGGTADEADKALKNMGEAIQRQDPLLRKVGASGLGTWDAMMKVSDAMERTAAGAGRGSAAMDLLGKKSDAAIAVLANGSQSVKAFGDHMQRIGAVMSDKAIERFTTVGDQIDLMKTSFEALKLTIADAVVPWLIKAIDLFAVLQTRLSAFIPMIQLIGHTLDFMNAVLENPLRFRAEMEAFTKVLGDDAKRLAKELAGANAQWEAMKKLLQSMRERRAPGPQLTREQGPFQLSDQLGNTDTSSDSKLRPTPFKGKLQIGPMLDEAKTHLTTFSEHMEKVAGTVTQAFETIGDALHHGIVDVMMNLTNRAQTFRSAIVSIFQAVRDGILRAIAEIVAAQVVKMFLKLLGLALSALSGNPVFAAAGGGFPEGVEGGIMAVAPAAGPGDFGGASAMAPTGGGRGGNTYIIQTIAAKDVFQSLASPTGAMRAANSRLIEISAAS